MGSTGIFGKHPAFGDFIGAGMSKPMQVALEEWLGAVLPRVRDNLAGVWQPYYDIALPLRFWLGEGVVPRALGKPVAGVLVFSHDKVGRRFPLIALREAGDMPPPTVVPDQRWYDALQARMLEHDTPETAGELAEMMDLADGFLPPAFDGGDAAFWAVHTAGQVQDLLTNVAATDHRRAAARRSYWWCAGDASRTATFHTMEGWPDAAVFQWLLAGNPATEEQQAAALAETAPAPEPMAEPEPEAAFAPGFDPAPDQQSDPFLAAAPVTAAAMAADLWVEEDIKKVPRALYAETDPEPSSGPESPFSIREAAEAADADSAPDEDPFAVDTEDAPAEVETDDADLATDDDSLDETPLEAGDIDEDDAEDEAAEPEAADRDDEDAPEGDEEDTDDSLEAKHRLADEAE